MFRLHDLGRRPPLGECYVDHAARSELSCRHYGVRACTHHGEAQTQDVLYLAAVCDLLCGIEPSALRLDQMPRLPVKIGGAHVEPRRLADDVPYDRALQFGCGARFYRGAWGSLKGGSANMDVLVALGTSIAFLFSLWITFLPVVANDWSSHEALAINEGMPYFETCAMLITFVLLGKTLESRAKGATNQAIESLMNLTPPVARVLRPGGSLQIWDAHIISAFPDPFFIDLDIDAAGTAIHTTYGILKEEGAQDCGHILRLCQDAGLRLAVRQDFDGWFYLRLLKKHTQP